MSALASSAFAAKAQGPTPAHQLSTEEMEKLQEIHELINLTLKEMPPFAKAHGQSYAFSVGQTVPYGYGFLPASWPGWPFSGA